MLNSNLKLNPKIFSDDCEQMPIRKGFGEGLRNVGEAHPEIVALSADLTESTQMHLFKERYPERFIEIGVAEQNLATVASGMAAMGKYPFFSSYAMFSPGRNWEQIRTTLAYNDLPAVVVGSHAGVSVGPDGGTHQAVEDIALMRVIPRMTVLSPCDSIQAKRMTEALAEKNVLAYLRLAREKTPVITTEETPFEWGKAQILYRPHGIAHISLFVTGGLTAYALRAAHHLERKGVRVLVVNIHTIKPLDVETVLACAKETNLVLTIEEHQISGGLGGTIAETLSKHHPTRMDYIGMHDQFGQSGTPTELIEHYGMGVDAIMTKVLELLEKK